MDDAREMTGEEAKRRMEICRDFLANNYSDIGEPNFTAFNMAIQALSQEPCEDAISRTIVQEEITKSIELKENPHQLWQRIQALPSVTQKSGKWIVHEKPHGIRYLECPYCNIWYLNEHLIRNSYCPNCGAKMESEE